VPRGAAARARGPGGRAPAAAVLGQEVAGARPVRGGNAGPDAAVAQAPATGRKPRVLVAGGGIGGLVFALAARRKGYDVTVFERDLSAVRGEGQYRGPIQIQSNALAALEAIDMAVAEEVMRVGCVTGDRINGLVDGVSGSWYAVHFSPCSFPVHLLRLRYSLFSVV
jgi:zeaxanthin epoxidase